MMRGKSFGMDRARNAFSVLAGILLCFLLVNSAALASPQAITVTSEYMMGEEDTLAQAKERARGYAMREAAERAGVYLESSTAVKNHQVTSDEVRALAGSVLKVQDVRYQKAMADGGIVVRATLRALVDPLDVETLRNRLRETTAQDEYRALLADYRRTQADYQTLQAEVRNLRSRAASSPSSMVRQTASVALAARLSDMDALNFVAEGNRLLWQKKFRQAVNAYDEALRHDPQNAAAYRGRGIALRALGEVQAGVQDMATGQMRPSALADLTRAIELAPEDAAGYLARGRYYESQRQYGLAEQDYSRAIALYGSAEHYLARAELFRRRHDAASALSDYQSAIAADNSTADAYYGMGWCYEAIGDPSAAIRCYRGYLERANPRSYDYRLLSAKKRIEALEGKDA